MPHEPSDAPPRFATVERRVLDVVSALAREVGGPRAERAVSSQASLERDLGLGSLERVELLLRLERALGRPLGDDCLSLDSPAQLTHAALAALAAAPDADSPLPPHTEPVLGAATAIGAGVRTLAESLWRHAQLDAARTHVLISEDGSREKPLSYGRLWQESAAVAGGLIARGVRPGDTVALMLPTGLDFLRAFMGIVAARAIAVPIYPPARLDRLAEYAARQSAILADAGARLLITFTEARPVAGLLRGGLPALADVLTADELAQTAAPLAAASGAGSDPALIQYTSGSTGEPKGVLLTHENLLANVAAIAAGVDLSASDVGVSWLPLYHDMGLIGAWLTCLHHGLPLTLLPPTAFLARPERWLWAIHRRRATLSAAPNFAYELCARRLSDEAIEGLDLSSWRAALNGAEPVSKATLDRFLERFRPCGFRPQAMTPVYGLAECSVALAFPPPGRGPRLDRVARQPFEELGLAQPAAQDDGTALEIVSVGRELPDHEVRIVDDAGDDVGERVVGRLVFRGPSATRGYYHRPEATAAITLPGGWLDSGDLAYRAGGEIHICGRRKDLVIKGGRNLVPQEIEEAASGVAGIRRGCVVAFGVPSPRLGTEALVVVAETRATDPAELDRLSAEVTARVAGVLDVPPDQVILVAPGSVPKTSSGKLRRSASRQLFLSGELGRPPVLPLAIRLRLGLGAGVERLRPLVRRARRVLYAAWLAATLPLVLVPLWLLVSLLPSRRLAFRLSRLGSRLVLTLLGCRLEVAGLERLPRDGALVLAANHASYVDVLALLALLPVDFVFVAKHEVLASPVIAPFVRRCGHLTVDRFDTAKSLEGAEAALEALRSGQRVLFFPEGTFAAATGLRPFRLGAFRSAVATATPVVPLALRGTRHVMRGDWRLPRPGPIRLWIGEPLREDGVDVAALVRLRDRAAAAIEAECGEPRLDLVAAGPEGVRS